MHSVNADQKNVPDRAPIPIVIVISSKSACRKRAQKDGGKEN